MTSVFEGGTGTVRVVVAVIQTDPFNLIGSPQCNAFTNHATLNFFVCAFFFWGGGLWIASFFNPSKTQIQMKQNSWSGKINISIGKKIVCFQNESNQVVITSWCAILVWNLANYTSPQPATAPSLVSHKKKDLRVPIRVLVFVWFLLLWELTALMFNKLEFLLNIPYPVLKLSNKYCVTYVSRIPITLNRVLFIQPFKSSNAWQTNEHKRFYICPFLLYKDRHNLEHYFQKPYNLQRQF